MKTAVIWVIKIYRNYISPLKLQCCRYHPTCSEYAITAIQKHGLIKGLAKSAYRILRCNPFVRGGYDPA